MTENFEIKTSLLILIETNSISDEINIRLNQVLKSIVPRINSPVSFVIYNLMLTLEHNNHYHFELFEIQVDTVHCLKYALGMQEILNKQKLNLEQLPKQFFFY